MTGIGTPNSQSRIPRPMMALHKNPTYSLTGAKRQSSRGRDKLGPRNSAGLLEQTLTEERKTDAMQLHPPRCRSTSN